MKIIPLTKNKFAVIDDDDYDKVSQYHWIYSGNGYAIGRINGKMTYLHRFILNAPKHMEVDHINGLTLDCRKVNIRTCSKSQNQANRRLSSNNTTGYKGVSWNKKDRKYRACIKINYKKIHLGSFETPEAAARAYNKAAREHFGDFAQLNKV